MFQATVARAQDLNPNKSSCQTDFQESPWAKFHYLEIVELIHGHRHTSTIVTFRYVPIQFGNCIMDMSATSFSHSRDCGRGEKNCHIRQHIGFVEYLRFYFIRPLT